MELFRKVFMNTTSVQGNDGHRKGSFEWKKENLPHDQLKRTADNAGRFSGIPAIPSDIGYSSGKDTAGVKKSGVVSQAASNPGVILGMGLTCLALLGMFKSSFIGDKLGAQKYMRYRIMAQFFTVTALVAGVTIFGTSYDREIVRETSKPAVAVLNKQ